MTTYTQSDLATRILLDLGVIGAEETPSAVDLIWASDTIDAVVPTLSAMGLPIWNGSEVVVPAEYLIPLSKRIGLDMAPSFGLMNTVEAEAAKRGMEQSLTIMANPRGGNPSVLRTDDATGSGRRFNWTTGI